MLDTLDLFELRWSQSWWISWTQGQGSEMGLEHPGGKSSPHPTLPWFELPLSFLTSYPDDLAITNDIGNATHLHKKKIKAVIIIFKQSILKSCFNFPSSSPPWPSSSCRWPPSSASAWPTPPRPSTTAAPRDSPFPSGKQSGGRWWWFSKFLLCHKNCHFSFQFHCHIWPASCASSPGSLAPPENTGSLPSSCPLPCCFVKLFVKFTL